MINRLLSVLIIFIISLAFINGCSNKKNEKIDELRHKINRLEAEDTNLKKDISKKAEEIGGLKKEINNLKTQNSIFKKDTAQKDITFEGTKLISIQILVSLLFISNTVWFIVYKRKQ